MLMGEMQLKYINIIQSAHCSTSHFRKICDFKLYRCSYSASSDGAVQREFCALPPLAHQPKRAICVVPLVSCTASLALPPLL